MRVEQAVQEVGQRQQGLASAQQLVPLVGRSSLSRALVAGRVVQVRPRVYSLEPLPPLPLHVVTAAGPAPEWVAHVRAGLLSAPACAASGRTAAALYGWGLLEEPAVVLDVAAATHVRVSDRRLRLRKVRGLVAVDVRVVAGTRPLRLSDAVTTVLQCCLDLPLLEAVVVCDSALRAGAVTVEQLARAASGLQGRTGAAAVRRVLELADRRAGSVLESVFRVHAASAGIPSLESQVVVLDLAGRHVLRADFADARSRLVVELDGTRWHPDPARDRRTDNLLAELGWRVLRFGWGQVVHDHAEVLRQVAAALGCPRLMPVGRVALSA